MVELLTNPTNWVAFLTLTSLEIVLGIDNIVFISILSSKLPQEQQSKARNLGLIMAMGARILLLLAISWIMGLTKELFSVLGHEFNGKDMILIIGGIFLVGKSTTEIHHKLEGDDRSEVKGTATFGNIIMQILLLDMVFSLDSVITAVAMVDEIAVMIAAVIVAVLVMLVSAGPISRFVERRPTVKMLALSFLLLIGVTLIADGFGQHIQKGYIYFAMGFSVFVEMLNLKIRKSKKDAVKFHESLEINPDASQS